jgi:hypothetical protein
MMMMKMMMMMKGGKSEEVESLDVQPPKKKQAFSDLPSMVPSDAPSIVPSGAPSDAFQTAPSKRGGNTEALGAVKKNMMMMMRMNRPGDLSDAPSMVPSDQPSSVPSNLPSSVTSALPTIDVEPPRRQRKTSDVALLDRKGSDQGTHRYTTEEEHSHRRLSETLDSEESRWLDTDPLFIKMTPPNRLSPTLAPSKLLNTPSSSTLAPTRRPIGAIPTISSDAPSDVPSDLPSLAPSDIGTSIPTIVLQDPTGRRRLSERATEDGRWLADPLFVKITPPNQLSATTVPTQEPVSPLSDSPSDVPSGAPSFISADANSALPTFEVPSSESQTDPLFVKFVPPSQAVPTQAPTVALPQSSSPSDFPSDAPSFVPVLISSEPPVAALTVKSFTLRSRQTEEMDIGTVSEFEMACGKEFFPTYLPLIHKASYEGLQCSVHSQAVVRSTDSRSLPEESFVEVTTGSVAIVMKVSAKAIQPPPRDFNEIVAKTLETYSTEFQQLLSDRTSYFESVESQTLSSAQQGHEATNKDARHGITVLIAAVCSAILAVTLIVGLLAAKGRKARGTSPEAMATLVDDGVAVEVFSTGSHRKSLDVEVRESHSSISSSATSPIPSTSEKIFTLGFPEHVLLNVPRRIDDAGMQRSQMRANRMYSFSTGVCSNESDLFDRSYKNETGSSDDESLNGIGLVESSTTGSRASDDFDDHIQSIHSLSNARVEGRNRFAWTRKLFGPQAGSPDARTSVTAVPHVHVFDFESPAVKHREVVKPNYQLRR